MDEQLIALNNKLTTIYTQLQEYNIKQSQYFSEIIDIINKDKKQIKKYNKND